MKTKTLSFLTGGLLLLFYFPLFGQHCPEDTLNYFRKSLGIDKLSETTPPPFRLITLNGDTLSLDQLDGKIIILHFWASWCVPCRKEMPELEKLYQTIKNENIPAVVLGISIDKKKDISRILPTIENWQITFPVASIHHGEISSIYWTWGIPVTYIISPKGYLMGRIMGSANWQENLWTIFLKVLRNC
ncbi:MAG: TlpA family protein disulfide reductase [Methanobacteriota archaeon]|nr:MAG: TlpA family protein disulfide reductase [Euryarchaeota archaeon]